MNRVKMFFLIVLPVSFVLIALVFSKDLAKQWQMPDKESVAKAIKEKRVDDAEELLKRSTKKLRQEHPQTKELAKALSEFGNFYLSQGRNVEAEAPLREAIEIDEQVSVINDNVLAKRYNDLGNALFNQGKIEPATKLYFKAVQSQDRATDLDDPSMLVYCNNLLNAYHETGKVAEQEPLLRHIVEIKTREKDGYTDPETSMLADARYKMGSLYMQMGQYSKAEPEFKEGVAPGITKRVFPQNRLVLALNLIGLAGVQVKLKNPTEAQKSAAEAEKIIDKYKGTDRETEAACVNNLAAVYASMNDFARAEVLFKKSLNLHEKQFGAKSIPVALCLNNLVSAYIKQKKFREAEPYAKRALDILQTDKTAPPADLKTSKDQFEAITGHQQSPEHSQ